jgi:hypothetical protein
VPAALDFVGRERTSASRCRSRIIAGGPIPDKDQRAAIVRVAEAVAANCSRYRVVEDMDLITTESEVLVNIETLKQYLQSSGIDRDFVLDLIQLGICFVVTEENAAPFFAPNRFIGYRNNTRHDHLHNEDKDTRLQRFEPRASAPRPPSGSV